MLPIISILFILAPYVVWSVRLPEVTLSVEQNRVYGLTGTNTAIEVDLAAPPNQARSPGSHRNGGMRGILNTTSSRFYQTGLIRVGDYVSFVMRSMPPMYGLKT